MINIRPLIGQLIINEVTHAICHNKIVRSTKENTVQKRQKRSSQSDTSSIMNVSMPFLSPQGLTDIEAEKKLKRRIQWRLNQRNSRQKRNRKAILLEQQNLEYREENRRLERKAQSLLNQNMLVSRHLIFSGNSAVKIIEEYYKVFANGFAMNCPVKQEYQRNFVHSIMTDETTFMNTQGASNVLNQWRLMTGSHHSLRIVPLSCEYVKEEDGVVVRALSRYIVRISRKTLATLYPHVLNNERLVQHLIGLEVDALDTVHSYFDVDGRIIRHDVVIDFVSPLIKLLGNVDDVASVLSGSHLRENGLVDIDKNEMASKRFVECEEITAVTSMNTNTFPSHTMHPQKKYDLDMLLSKDCVHY